MTFRLTISLDNEAFNPTPEFEVGRILDAVAARVRGGATDGRILDYNGNYVGNFVMRSPSK